MFLCTLGTVLIGPLMGFILISGKKTLREIERATGVPAEDIALRLGMPFGGFLKNENSGRHFPNLAMVS